MSRTITLKAIIILFFSTCYLTGLAQKEYDINVEDPEVYAEQWLSSQNEMGFIENQGQMTDMDDNAIPNVFFKTEAPNLNIWITNKGLVIQTFNVRKVPLKDSELSEMDKEEEKRKGKRKTNKIWDWERVDIELAGASIKKENIFKEIPLQANFNFFYAHCPDGIYGVKEHEKITIKEVYPNIDWVLYRKQDGTFKYDFVVHPGANYKQIKLLYKSKTPIKINEQGEVELYTAYGNVKENKPVSFYENQEVITNFKQNYQRPITINGTQAYETSISFNLNTQLETFNSKLTIDPQLTWGTFYGGNSYDGPNSITTDAAGNVFVTGYIVSTNFPTQTAGTYFQGANVGGYDAFILKFDNNGNNLWATYYGGSGNDYGIAIATDATGNVFVSGYSYNNTFPTTIGPAHAGGQEITVTKFDNNGNRLWATFYGGAGSDAPLAIATDAAGNVFVTGTTTSTNFPTLNAYQSVKGLSTFSSDTFIMKLNSSGTTLWATYAGGNKSDQGSGIATDAAGNVFVIGHTESTDFPTLNALQPANAGGNDVIILKFDNSGTCLFATHYGGTGWEYGFGIAIDASDNVFISGWTQSTDFPTLNASQPANAGGNSDAFISKLDNSGTTLWSTYYGGTGLDRPQVGGLAVDPCGNVYMSFDTESTDVLTQASCGGGYHDNSFNGGSKDQFINCFDSTGVLLWATYVGGDGDDFRALLDIDINNNLFVSGEWKGITNNATYPLIDPGTYYDGTFNGADDGFMMKFTTPACFCPTPLPVKITSYDASCTEGIATLNWATATEINNDYFTIERSRDAINFEEVGTVKGNGNSNTIINYTWSDDNLISGTTYYRLKQTDFNGTYEYHGIRTVNCEQSGDISIYPNPFIYSFTVQLSESTTYPTTVEVIDYLGRKVYTQAIESQSVEITLDELPSGTYFIKVFNQTTQVVERIVKMK